MSPMPARAISLALHSKPLSWPTAILKAGVLSIPFLPSARGAEAGTVVQAVPLRLRVQPGRRAAGRHALGGAGLLGDRHEERLRASPLSSRMRVSRPSRWSGATRLDNPPPIPA